MVVVLPCINLGMSMHKCGADVKVLAINTQKHFVKEENISSEYMSWSKIQSVRSGYLTSPV